MRGAKPFERERKILLPITGLRAEGVGFEPTRPFGLPVFKTGAINHSTTPPENLDREKCAIAARLSKRRNATQIGCSVEHGSTNGYVHVNLSHRASEG